MTQRITRLLVLLGLLVLIIGASKSAASETAAPAGAPDSASTVVDGLSSLPGDVIESPPPPPLEMIEYYAADAIGSTRVVFAPDGTVTGRVDFAPFGEELPGANAPPERFTGQPRETEAGMDCFGTRYYQSRVGRFGTIDPSTIGATTDPQRWNRYAYSLNNPLKFIDPTGRQANACDESSEEPQLHVDDTPRSSGCPDRWSFGGLLEALAYSLATTFDAIPGFTAVLQAPDADGTIATSPVKIDPAMQAVADVLVAVASLASGGIGIVAEAGEGAALAGELTIASEEAAMAGKAASAGANSVTQARNLARQLTSEEQTAQALAGKGEAIIGAGTTTELRDAQRLAQQYGGRASDWAKMGGDSSAIHGVQTPAGKNFAKCTGIRM